MFSSIKRLFTTSSPTAVLFTVISIVVYPINSCLLLSKFFNMFKITFVHIISKIFKSFPKKFYTPTTIVLESFIVWVITSTLHIVEFMVKFCVTHSMFCLRFFPKTSTTLYHTTSNICNTQNFQFPAIAFAKPIPMMVFVSEFRRNQSQIIKFHTRMIYFLSHTNIYYINLKHLAT